MYDLGTIHVKIKFQYGTWKLSYIRIFKFILYLLYFTNVSFRNLPRRTSFREASAAFRGLNPVRFLMNNYHRKLLHKNAKKKRNSIAFSHWLVFLNDCLADENFRQNTGLTGMWLVGGWLLVGMIIIMLVSDSTYWIETVVTETELTAWLLTNNVRIMNQWLTCLNFYCRIQPCCKHFHRRCVWVQVNFSSYGQLYFGCVLDLWCVVVFLVMLVAMVVGTVTAVVLVAMVVVAIGWSFAAF